MARFPLVFAPSPVFQSPQIKTGRIGSAMTPAVKELSFMLAVSRQQYPLTASTVPDPADLQHPSMP